MVTYSENARDTLPTFITISDFCRDYAISRTQFYRIVNAKEIPLIKIGRMSRIRFEDAQNWAANLQEKAVAQ